MYRPSYASKICNWPRLRHELGFLKAKGKKIVFTNGCFDLIHTGHTLYLDQARSLGDLLVVGLNTDRSVRALKGEARPIRPEGRRAEVLAALASVDFVTMFDEDTPAELIEWVEPDVLVKGGDWTVDKIVGADFVQARGGRVESLPLVEGEATTAIIARIIHGSKD